MSNSDVWVILGIVMVLSLLVISTTFAIVKFKTRHRHDWELLRARQVFWGDIRYVTKTRGEPKTELYWRCKTCRKLDSYRIDGHWKEEEVRGR